MKMTDLTQQPPVDPGGPTDPGTANAAADKLTKSAEVPSLLNDTEVDLDDDKSERTIDKKDGEEPTVDPHAFDPSKLNFEKAGLKIDAKDPAFGEFTNITKKHGLKQEAAQEYVDLYAKTVKSAADKPYQIWRDTQKGWQDEVMADPEMGGKNFDNVRRVVGTALQEYGDPGVKSALDFTGAGNNPAIIRTFYRMAKALAEPGPVAAEPPRSMKPDSPGAALYPHLVKNRGE
jgi:hypothetical protein